VLSTGACIHNPPDAHYLILACLLRSVTKHLLTCGQSLICSLQVEPLNCGEYVNACHQLTLFYEGEASFFVVEL